MSNRTPKVPIVVSRKPDGRLRVDVVVLSDWDGFTKLIAFLEKNYGAAVADRVDGPDTRKAVLRIRAQTLELVHEDPWGNFLSVADAEGEPLLNEIAEDLRKRLAGFCAS